MIASNLMGADKARSLIGQLRDRDNLERAWEHLRENDGCAGIDGMTIARFEDRSDRYLEILHQELRLDAYRPRPVLTTGKIKRLGTTRSRPLGIPTILDRVCQQALCQVLTPIFEPMFSEASFAHRPGRSVAMALGRVRESLEQGACWILEVDLTDFFGTLSHELLVDKLAERVADGRVLDLVRAFLSAGVLRDRSFEPTAAGVSQRGVPSAMLANVYLHRFDEEMVGAGFALTRYVDDVVVACRSRSETEQALTRARAVLEGDLGLELNPEKTRISHITQGFRFLGFYIEKEMRILQQPAWPPGALRGGGRVPSAAPSCFPQVARAKRRRRNRVAASHRSAPGRAASL